ncbi:MAG TPA: patatin-like phospholipase family protein [Candidatus Hydromicrobium sp.]
MNIFRRKRKVGIALSGGAARALSHIGVLEVLEKLGVKLDAVAGTSMGAIIGAFYCSGITLEEIRSYVKSMNWKSFLLFSDLVLSQNGIINGRRVENVLRKFLGNKTFKDCKIPFCCVAADLIKGEKVILSEGKLVDAVRASISIPGFFSAVCMDNRILIDGGLIEPLPTEAIKTKGVNFIIASSIRFEKDREKYINFFQENKGDFRTTEETIPCVIKSDFETGKRKFPDLKKMPRLKRRGAARLSVNNIIDTSFNIMHREISKKFLKLADLVIEPEVGDFGFFDLMHGSQIIQRGVEAAREKIPEIKRRLNL